MSRLLGVFVDCSSLFPFTNDSANCARADLDGHIVDRGIFRKRKRVDRLDLLGSSVLELLRDINARDESADGATNVGVTERTRSRDGSVLPDNTERSGSYLGRSRNGGLHGPENNGRQSYEGKTHYH